MARKKPTKNTAKPLVRRGTASLAPRDPALLSDLQRLIRPAKPGEQVAQAVNSALVLLYWQVGKPNPNGHPWQQTSVPATVRRLSRHCRKNWPPSSGSGSPGPACSE